ncbi:MAG TPA: hypothetical protein VG711_04050 [Phycisphaerales bacterium]|nr:hypothetical protein [Phycisphaerales bacterium]
MAASLSTRRLVNADIGWLKRVRLGLKLQLLASVSQVGLTAISIVLVPNLRLKDAEFFAYLVLSMTLCSFVTTLIGLWFLTSPNVGVLTEAKSERFRLLLRGWIVVDALTLLVTVVGSQRSGGPDEMVAGLLIAALTGHGFLTLKYIQHLALLAGERSLPGFAGVGAALMIGIGGWWFVVFEGVSVLGVNGRLSGSGGELMGCCGCASGLACIWLVFHWHIALMLLWSLLSTCIRVKESASGT